MNCKTIIKSLRLPTLSHSLYNLLELEEHGGQNLIKQLQRIIEHDPLLATNIIKIANSPLFGFASSVKTISHAIQLLGFQKIKNIAFSYSIFDFFKKVNYSTESGQIFNTIIKKNLINSVVSSILIGKFEPEKKDEISLAALLLDIGQILLFLYEKEKYQQIYSVYDNELIPKETQAFGFNHLDLAKTALDEWKLPEQIKKAIDNHYQNLNNDKFYLAIYCGNKICEWLLSDQEIQQEKLAPLSATLKELLNLDFVELEDTLLALTQMVEAYLIDFPELQKDLTRTIKASSELIINLVQKDFLLSNLTTELSQTQQKLLAEKNLLAHILNISSFFSALVPPLKSIASLFEYFQEFLTDYQLAFLYKDGDSFRFFNSSGAEQYCPREIIEGEEFKLAKEKKSLALLSEKSSRELKLPADYNFLIFPITYHFSLHSFLLLGVKNIAQLSEVEASYFKILCTIIANSFQNFLSFENIKKEINKKNYISKELLEIEKDFFHNTNLLNLNGPKYAAIDALPVIFHKLKNKLTPIMGYAQILKMKTREPFFVERLDKIENTCSELTELMNLLREYFRISDLVVEDFNLNTIIKNITEQARANPELQEIFFKLELQENLPEIKLNQTQIAALLINLIDNSAEALKEKKEKVIQISTSCFQDVLTLKIKDNGCGIAKEELPLIFSPFYSTKPGHIGIGLTICEKIIHNHNAKLEIRSDKNSGTEFIINFPLPASPNVPKKKILLVDDEEFLLELIEEFLNLIDHYEIKAVNSVQEALEILRAEEFDLVISDLNMPKISGEQIYRHLKSKAQENKFLAITADPDDENFSQFLTANKIEYLKKPFEMVLLMNKIKEKLN